MTFESKNHARKVQRKQKRLQHMISNDSGVVCCDEPTRVTLLKSYPFHSIYMFIEMLETDHKIFAFCLFFSYFK